MLHQGIYLVVAFKVKIKVDFFKKKKYQFEYLLLILAVEANEDDVCEFLMEALFDDWHSHQLIEHVKHDHNHRTAI